MAFITLNKKKNTNIQLYFIGGFNREFPNISGNFPKVIFLRLKQAKNVKHTCVLTPPTYFSLNLNFDKS